MALQKIFRIGERHDVTDICEEVVFRPVFSNYSWVSPIETDVVELVPSGTGSGATSYVLRFTTRTANPRPGKAFSLFDEVAGTLVVICGFALNAYFAASSEEVLRQCHERPRFEFGIDQRRLVPRVFQTEIHGSVDDVERAVDFSNKIIRLPRQNYRAVLRGLHIRSDNPTDWHAPRCRQETGHNDRALEVLRVARNEAAALGDVQSKIEADISSMSVPSRMVALGGG